MILPEKTISSISAPSHKHDTIDSLTVPYTFFGLASPISITQGVGSSELCVTRHSQTRSLPSIDKAEGWELSIG